MHTVPHTTNNKDRWFEMQQLRVSSTINISIIDVASYINQLGVDKHADDCALLLVQLPEFTSQLFAPSRCSLLTCCLLAAVMKRARPKDSDGNNEEAKTLKGK